MNQLELNLDQLPTQIIKPMVNEICVGHLSDMPDAICWDDWVDDQYPQDYDADYLAEIAKEIAWEHLTSSGLDRCSANHHVYGFCSDADIMDCCDGGEE